MKDLLSLYPSELEKEITDAGFPAFRARQLTEWLSKGCRRFDSMSNLPKAFRIFLDGQYELFAPEVLRKQVSQIDGTVKFLWKLVDGHSVETVLMQYRYGNTVCISSQVGCRQGCAFCASTIGGLIRNLTAGEMLDEVLFTELCSGKPVSNIVLMGIGEPLDNLDNVIRFLRLISDKRGRNIGLRHITVSTCGIPEGISRLSEENLPVTLTLSLHAPFDEIRSRIMPSNHGIECVLEACRGYYAATGRRISFEYAMIRDVNDSAECAHRLARLAKPGNVHVNLIPLNYVEERVLKASSPETIRAFQTILNQEGINVTVRRRLGSDIDASCGQLRRKYNRTV